MGHSYFTNLGGHKIMKMKYYESWVAVCSPKFEGMIRNFTLADAGGSSAFAEGFL